MHQASRSKPFHWEIRSVFGELCYCDADCVALPLCASAAAAASVVAFSTLAEGVTGTHCFFRELRTSFSAPPFIAWPRQ